MIYLFFFLLDRIEHDQVIVELFLFGEGRDGQVGYDGCYGEETDTRTDSDQQWYDVELASSSSDHNDELEPVSLDKRTLCHAIDHIVVRSSARTNQE